MRSEIDLEEVKRRAEGMLVRQGYTMYGRWTNKYFDDGEKSPLWSMLLRKLDETRILLWEEQDHWRAMISIAVGEDGEFPVAEGIIKRYQKDRPFPSFNRMEARIKETREKIYQWHFSLANTYSAQALARLANYFLVKKKYRKVGSILKAITNGEIDAATVTEALSIVQSRYASSRADRVESALIWAEVYR